MMRLCVGQNKGCLTRVWHSLWSWLKLMRSLRAAVVILTGIEIKPKVRWPFQTVEAMQKLLLRKFPRSLCKLICKISLRPGRMQGESREANAHEAPRSGIRAGLALSQTALGVYPTGPYL